MGGCYGWLLWVVAMGVCNGGVQSDGVANSWDSQVDDAVREIREYLITVAEWDNTFMIFSSDHGYSLGQFRVDSDKTQVALRASPCSLSAFGSAGGRCDGECG